MKIKSFILFVFALYMLQNADAQCINGTKSYPIYKLGAQLVDQFDNQESEIVRIEYDLVFSSKETTRNLSADWEYTIVGFADDGVKDLDLKIWVYDDLLEKWTLVSEDSSVESFAIVTVKPPVDALYKAEIIVYQFNEGYTAARYGLMFVHD
jgi:hypothetical protein